MPASYTSGQSSYPRGHPTYWASSQRSRSLSSTPCHGAWTSPFSAHLSTEWECTAYQIETSICTCSTTTHQFIWRRRQHKCSALSRSPMECGAVREHLQDFIILSLTLSSTLPEWLLQEQCESGSTAFVPVSDVSAPRYTNGVRLLA